MICFRHRVAESDQHWQIKLSLAPWKTLGLYGCRKFCCGALTLVSLDKDSEPEEYKSTTFWLTILSGSEDKPNELLILSPSENQLYLHQFTAMSSQYNAVCCKSFICFVGYMITSEFKTIKLVLAPCAFPKWIAQQGSHSCWTQKHCLTHNANVAHNILIK